MSRVVVVVLASVGLPIAMYSATVGPLSTFTDGEIASATQVNDNFAELRNAVDTLGAANWHSGTVVESVFSPDVYTQLLLHADGAPGTQGFTDASAASRAVGANGGVAHTATNKFGGGAIEFDGSGDYLRMTSEPAIQFGTGDFTIDFWVRLTTPPANLHQLFFKYDGNGAWMYAHDTGLIRTGFGSGSIVSTTNVYDGQWHHVAAVRSGNTYRLFIDGTQEASYSVSGSGDNNTDFFIGRHPSDSARDLLGNIDEFRVSMGIARWTTNFSVPTAPHPGDGDGYMRVEIGGTTYRLRLEKE